MKRRGASIGTFDGVHKGHLSVIGTLLAQCREKGLEPIAITFDKHPLAHISPERAPVNLTSLKRKKELLSREGVEPVVFSFDESLRSLTAEEWMKKIHDELGVDLLVIGYDNTFGSDGLNMSVSDYRAIGEKIGMEVVEAPELKGISSSAIRKAVVAGDVEKAAEMAGRIPLLEGEVVEGNRLGRTIGFPTANVEPEKGFAVPALGVYAGEAELPDGEVLPAMINIGVRPTLTHDKIPVIEAHVINWSGDLYGKKLKLRFLSRLRDELRFESPQELKSQLEEDREKVLKSSEQS